MPGYVLQESAVVSPFSRTNSPSGDANSIVVRTTLKTKFYRPFKP